MIALPTHSVVKRDGTIVPAEPARIIKAMERAFNETKETVSQFDLDTIATTVVEAIGQQGSPVSVETIQDLVVAELYRRGFRTTADAYVAFRQRKERLRQTSHELDTRERGYVEATRQAFGTDLRVFQFLNKYSRFQESLGRRETWPETVDRVLGFFEKFVGEDRPGAVTGEEWARLREGLFNLRATPSMRMMQMAGPAAERCNVAIYNCSFCGISDLDYFSEMLYILMQGTGQGFSTESDFIEDLPKIKSQRGNAQPDTIVIDDSTEGWCDSLKQGLYRWFDGHDIRFDYSLIRRAGAPLKTKGGKASGPDPLRELHEFARRVILKRQKRRLRDIDVHDIACKVGKIVVAGGVRRAAMIGLSDLDSDSMRHAKDGQFWVHSPHRTMANNSAVYEEKPDVTTFMREWMNLAESGTGERGIFNRGGLGVQLPARRRKLNRGHIMGTNPCGEIILRASGQFCNLSIAVVRPEDTLEDLKDKVEIATIFGILQSLMTKFRYLRPRWKENCEEERLLGVDLLGAQDNPLLRPSNPEQRQVLAKLNQHAVLVASLWSERLGINMPTAVTCIKPGGNSSVLLGTGNSVTGWYSRYIKRHVRVNAIDPMAKFLIDAGVPHWPEYDDPNPTNPRVWVFAFPMKAPDGAVVANELVEGPAGRSVQPATTAIEQLENWLAFKECWTEHNPSVTIFVGDDEWLDVGHWVYSHWDMVGGLSFLPRDNSLYPLLPNMPITAEEYKDLEASFPRVQWEKFFRYEGGSDHTTLARDFACTGDKCAI